MQTGGIQGGRNDLSVIVVKRVKRGEKGLIWSHSSSPALSIMRVGNNNNNVCDTVATSTVVVAVLTGKQFFWVVLIGMKTENEDVQFVRLH